MNFFIKAENTLQNKIGKINYLLLSLICIVLAVTARLFLFDFESYDYMSFLSPWYDFIKSNGGFNALKFDFSNYSPPYLYLLVICTYLPLQKIYAIKFVSILFDFLAAFLVYVIVKQKYKSVFLPLISALTILFIPTVIMNSAMWGQCDIIFTCGLLASILYLMKGKYFKAFVFYSLAFAIKLQAIFLFPIFIILYFKRRFSILHFLMIPGMYVLLSIPCLLAGRPFSEVLLIYTSQASAYAHLTLNAPNLYQWIPIYSLDINFSAIAFAMTVILIFCFICYKGLKNTESNTILKLSMILLLLVPFVLPQMHERYFFPADILSVVYAFYFPKYYYLPIAVILTSYFSYYPYLFPYDPMIKLEYLAFVLLALIIITCLDLYRTSFEKFHLV